MPNCFLYPISALFFYPRRLFFVLLCLPVLFLASQKEAHAAEAWNASVFPLTQYPVYFFSVDKARQEISLVAKEKDTLAPVAFVGTTGRAGGDKLREGDLKTPEGVYFVVKHIPSGLDYFKYGNEAFTLNYPNPVDRLRKKTGHGIWIHGRGEPLIPMQTEGCVSMLNDELETLRPLLVQGAPVLMAQTVSFPTEKNSPDAGIAQLLQAKVEAWGTAWSGKSADFFDYYDTASYGVAQRQSFAKFKAQKEKVFKKAGKITITITDIRALPGPGYWVTWFNQTYEAPGVSEKGTRRLYWSPDATGDYKIVGMEWISNLDSTLRPVQQKPSAGRSWQQVAPGKALDGS